MSVVCPKNYGTCGAAIEYDPDRLFVLMPFSESVAPQSLFFDVLQPLPGWEVIRADSDLSRPEIWCKICANIQSSRAVIADLSGANPNVFLELGLTWGLGKPFILLTQEIGKLPFDTRSFHVIRYQRMTTQSNQITNPRKIQDEIARALKALPIGDRIQRMTDYVVSEFNEVIEQAKKRTAGLWRRVEGEWKVQIDDGILKDLIGDIVSEESRSPYRIMVSLLRAYPECKSIKQISSETDLNRTTVFRTLTGRYHKEYSSYFAKCADGYRLSDDGLHYFIDEQRTFDYMAAHFSPSNQ
jgi:hypothetical protein